MNKLIADWLDAHNAKRLSEDNVRLYAVNGRVIAVLDYDENGFDVLAPLTTSPRYEFKLQCLNTFFKDGAPVPLNGELELAMAAVNAARQRCEQFQREMESASRRHETALADLEGTQRNLNEVLRSNLKEKG